MPVPPDDTYRKGDEVFVFYRMDKRCQPTRKYIATLDAKQGAYRPRIGMSEGWVPATVSADQDKNVHAGEVSIEYSWVHFYTKQGRVADSESEWTEWYKPDDVRSTSFFSSVKLKQSLVPLGSRPELAIINFRWGGQNEIGHCAQWGDTGISASDRFLESFLDSAVVTSIQGKYEVWTVYIEDSTDMVKIADAAHIIFGEHHPVRRAKHVSGMYFLYPTAFEEGCVPTQETGSDGGAGLVDQKSFFRMVNAIERAGIPTRFPHCSGMYEQLASKRWTFQLALTPHLRLPPTVSVPRMLIEQGCEVAAAKAISALQAVKRQQAALRGEPIDKVATITKGVAKLGFSWEALDVKFWEKEDGLKNSLYQLTQMIEISDEYTAQPHDLEAIMIQEYIKHDLELRIYTVEGKVEAAIYTKFCRIKENLEFGDFEQSFVKDQAAKDWMDGDLAALEDGERQCRELSQHWLDWLHSQMCEMPPAIRFDFFVARHPGGEKGKAEVWTLEICELGFSMLAHKQLPKKVFAAMLKNCLSGPESGWTVEESACKRLKS